jgi:hypothetical protein
MITIIGSTANPIVLDNRPQSELLTHLFVSMGYRMRQAIRALYDLIERRFAAFAGVPYEDPSSRQQWEQFFETELELIESSRRVNIGQRKSDRA